MLGGIIASQRFAGGPDPGRRRLDAEHHAEGHWATGRTRTSSSCWRPARRRTATRSAARWPKVVRNTAQAQRRGPRGDGDLHQVAAAGRRAEAAGTEMSSRRSMPRESGAFVSASIDESGQGRSCSRPSRRCCSRCLSACVRYLGEQAVPLGQIVFFRAAFAIVPVLLIDAWRRELADVVRTDAPVRPSRPRHDQHVRHVPQLRGAGAAAAGRRDRDLVRGALDHRGVRRVVSRRARPHLSLVRGRGRLRRHHRDAVALPQLRAIRGRRLGDRRRHRRRRCAACSPPSPTPAR